MSDCAACIMIIGMSGQAYDVIVVGVGGMGSAACCHLARRGLRVLGLERFDIPHELGSSAGSSRVIRLAYFEDPLYVPLVRRAYELWRELEAAAGERLLVTTGGVDIGAPECGEIVGVQAGLAENGISFEKLDAAALRRRFPVFEAPDHHVGIYQEETGFLLPERCIVAHVEAALSAGAEVHAHECVTRWNDRSDCVEVQTDRGCYSASQMVVTAGPWLSQLCAELGRYLQVERQVQGWFLPSRPKEFEIGRMPVFIHHLDDGSAFYGLPHFGRPGVKVCRHHGGNVVKPDQVDRRATREDEEVIRGYMSRHLPGANGPVMAMKVCLYTNTPDRAFIIDRHPAHERIVIAGGFSGHGFKFASVVGELLGQMVVEGKSVRPLDAFSIGRFRQRASSG